MLLPIVALIIIFFAYQLLIKGWLYKLIAAIIFPIATRFWLWHQFPATQAVCITISGIGISYAVVIPTVLLILALMTIKAE